MSRRVIGLYGGTGAGKSSAARWFAGRGALVIDADAVSREVSAPGGSAYAALRQAFPEFFDDEGVLNRRALGAAVFADETARLRLESIVHPLMRERIKELISGAEEDLVVLDCALLLKPVFRDLVDERWLITASPAVRRGRIMARDGLDTERAEQRMASQASDAELAAAADHVISNDGSEEELAAKLAHEIAEIHQKA